MDIISLGNGKQYEIALEILVFLPHAVKCLLHKKCNSRLNITMLKRPYDCRNHGYLLCSEIIVY